MQRSGHITRREVAGAALLSLAGLFPPPAQGDRATDAAEPLEARVRRIEDTEEIRSLLVTYGRFLDAHDLPSFSKLFASNGEWIGGFGSAKGPSAILTLMEKNLPARPAGKAGSTYHLLTNFLIEVHGDSATAWSRWSFVVTGSEKQPSMLYGGHYDDAFIREGGKWKFLRRAALTDIPASDARDSR
jgi:hypothetical protein